LADHSSLKIGLSEVARRDIATILRRSRRDFGQAARLRYQRLIYQGLDDIAADPERLGSSSCSDVLEGGRTYHLRFSRDKVVGDRVKEPRHLLVYRRRESDIEVIRILHDAQDPKKHLPESYWSH
jgi:toxin ParE1/3/4